MKKFKIKSYCKVNLSLKVLNRLSNNHHNIMSLITFCKVHDVISVSKIKNSSDIVTFSGKFKKKINKKKNTIIEVLHLLRDLNFLKNQSFKIDIKKNIPHGAGLGGGSSNAADLLNYFNSNLGLKIKSDRLKKIARKIGFDVPINLERKNTFLTGEKDKILRLKNKFRLNLLIVYPNIICSTKKVYKKNKKISLIKIKHFFRIKNKKQLIGYLKRENNDLENTVIKIYPKIREIINFIKSIKGCYFSRITGSGSACIGVFSNMENTIKAKKMIKAKYPRYWCAVSKTI